MLPKSSKELQMKVKCSAELLLSLTARNRTEKINSKITTQKPKMKVKAALAMCSVMPKLSIWKLYNQTKKV